MAMNSETIDDNKYVQRVYTQIIILAVLMHMSYVVAFSFLMFRGAAVYNIGSVIFYLIMMALVKRNLYRIVVSAIHVEVCLFVSVCTIAGGWEMGFFLILIALSTLVYFCPFEHAFIPYLFSGLEIVVFFALRLYTAGHEPLNELPEGFSALFLFMYNAIAGFVIILYACFTSKVSAAVTRKALIAENKNLSDQANHDYLTGLLSRRSFLKWMEEHTDEVQLVMIGDIDDFKHVNDTYGHACGDYILGTVANLMRKYCGKDARICRWGGEEFLFLFHGISYDKALEQIRELRDAIRAYDFIFEGQVIHITLTFGLSKVVKGDNILENVDSADVRMYEGKQRGKDRIVD